MGWGGWGGGLGGGGSVTGSQERTSKEPVISKFSGRGREASREFLRSGIGNRIRGGPNIRNNKDGSCIQTAICRAEGTDGGNGFFFARNKDIHRMATF